MVDVTPERLFNLAQRQHFHVRGAVQHVAHAVFGHAGEAHQIAQALQVAQARHVGIRHEVHFIGHVQRGGRARAERAARIDHHVFVTAPQHLDRVLDVGRIGRPRTSEVGRRRQHVEPAVVARDHPRHRLRVDPVELVEQVEQREFRTHAQEQADVASARLQVDDHRRPVGDPPQLGRTIHRERGGASTTLRAEKRNHHVAGQNAMHVPQRVSNARGPIARRCTSAVADNPEAMLSVL